MKFRALMIAALLTAPLAGCWTRSAPSDGPLFCDVEELRPFPSREVIEYRVQNDRDNVVRDVRTNETFEKWCAG